MTDLSEVWAEAVLAASAIAKQASGVENLDIIPPFVITGHSRSKNGVASLAYVPVIPIHVAQPRLPDRDRRDKPGDDEESAERSATSPLAP
jgi:hypothetical protein